MGKKHMRPVAVIFTLLIYLLSVNSAAAASPPCLFYAYTESGEHAFLLRENTSVFGSELRIKHNCEDMTVRIDGEFYASSNQSMIITIPEGKHNFTFESPEYTTTYSNVGVLPDRLTWIDQYNEWTFQTPDVELIDIAAAELQANWGVFWGVIIVWILSTYVYWTLINNYVQRNYIEEVKS